MEENKLDKKILIIIFLVFLLIIASFFIAKNFLKDYKENIYRKGLNDGNLLTIQTMLSQLQQNGIITLNIGNQTLILQPI